MTAAAGGATAEYSSLVLPDRVHSRVFTDPSIFQQEMARIYHRSWVFVGHESEVARAGDYVLKNIGRQPVILSRDEHGKTNLLINRCRRRGATVWQAEQGSSTFFRCSYHGWTYRNEGQLIGVTYPDA